MWQCNVNKNKLSSAPVTPIQMIKQDHWWSIRYQSCLQMKHCLQPPQVQLVQPVQNPWKTANLKGSKWSNPSKKKVKSVMMIQKTKLSSQSKRAADRVARLDSNPQPLDLRVTWGSFFCILSRGSLRETRGWMMARIYGEIAASASMFFFALSSYSMLKATIPISFSFFSEKRGFVQCLSRKGKSITTTHQPTKSHWVRKWAFHWKALSHSTSKVCRKKPVRKGINLSAKNIKVGHFIKSQWITLSTMFPRKKSRNKRWAFTLTTSMVFSTLYRLLSLCIHLFWTCWCQ